MTENRPKVYLIIFGNLLILAVGGGLLGLFLLHLSELLLPSGLVLGIVHIAVSVKSLRLFKNKYGMTAGRYIALGVMPALALSALMFIAGIIIMYVRMPVDGDASAVPLLFAMFPAGYSLFYFIGSSIVIAIRSLD